MYLKLKVLNTPLSGSLFCCCRHLLGKFCRFCGAVLPAPPPSGTKNLFVAVSDIYIIAQEREQKEREERERKEKEEKERKEKEEKDRLEKERKEAEEKERKEREARELKEKEERDGKSGK